jgi:membrane-associated PAP2 superfamily phosphatase
LHAPLIERYGKPSNFRFIGMHLGLPLAAVLLADRIYSLQGEQWVWRESWVTRQLLYQGGKWFSNAARPCWG